MSAAPRTLDVCLASNWFHPVLTGGGQQFRQYGPGLKRHGTPLRVVTLAGPETAGAPAEVDDIHIERLPVDGSRAAGQPHRLSALLLQAAVRQFGAQGRWPDVLTLFSASRHHLSPMLQLRRRGVALSLCFTMYPDPLPANPWVRLKAQCMERLIYRQFSLVTVYTSVMADELARRGVSRSALRVIPFGVDTRRFQPVAPGEREVVRRRLGLPARGPVVLFVGSVIERKGCDLLAAAWAEVLRQHPDATLVFAGPFQLRSTFVTAELRAGHERFARNLQAAVQALPRPESVVFAGQVSNTQDYFQAADVFAFPSRHEGFGAVIIEAMAAGLPCVLSPFLGFPREEFGRPGEHFVLVPHDPAALAGELTALLARPDRRLALGLAARTWAVQKLDLDLVVADMASAFRSVARPMAPS